MYKNSFILNYSYAIWVTPQNLLELETDQSIKIKVYWSVFNKKPRHLIRAHRGVTGLCPCIDWLTRASIFGLSWSGMMTAKCGTRHALRMRTEAVHLKATHWHPSSELCLIIWLSFVVREAFLVWSVAVFVLKFGKTFGDAVLLSFVWVTVQTSCCTPDLLLIQQKLLRWISIRSRVAELVCTATFAYMLREFHLFFSQKYAAALRFVWKGPRCKW